MGLCVAAPAAHAQESGEISVDRIQEIVEEINNLELEITDAEASRSGWLAALQESDDRRVDIESRIAELDAEIAGLLAQVDQKAAEIAATQAAIDLKSQELALSEQALVDRREVINARAVALYTHGGGTDFSLIFSATDLGEFVRRVEYLDVISEADGRLVADIAALSNDILEQRTSIEAEQAALTEAQIALVAQEQTLEGLRAQQQERRAEVQAEIDERAAIVADIESQIAAINGEIDGLEAEQAEITAILASGSVYPGEPPAAGQMWRPVPGPISSPFGYRVHPIAGVQRLHTGADMRASCGDAIFAADDGQVVFAGWKGGYGNATIIDHGGGVATLYAHQSQINVGQGQIVAGGDPVGLVGTTGYSTGCHLHFEVRIAGEPVDPAPWISG